MARFVLITGMMGSGKSAVSELLRKKHYIVIDSDTEVKKLYDDPVVFQYLVRHIGKKVVADLGSISLPEMKKFVCSDTENKKQVMDFLVNELSNRLYDKYKNSSEVIFVEAALTPEIVSFRFALDMHDAVIVHSDTAVRQERLMETRKNYVPDDGLERLQSIENLNGYGANHAVAHIDNNGTLEELNTQVIKVLESGLGITHAEKLATYIRFLKESPAYCHDNAWCYSFYNMGGCDSCPFPCERQDMNFQKLNAETGKGLTE